MGEEDLLRERGMGRGRWKSIVNIIACGRIE
jgi:hypothetical protein